MDGRRLAWIHRAFARSRDTASANAARWLAYLTSPSIQPSWPA